MTSKISSDSSSLKKQKKKKSKPQESPPNPNPIKPLDPNPKSSTTIKPLDPNPKSTTTTTKIKESPMASNKVTASPAPPSKKRKSKENDDGGDNLTILEAVIKFREDNGGANPTLGTMQPLFDSIKDSLLGDFTLNSLYNRMRVLRNKYYKLRDGGHVLESPADQAFFELSDRAWDGMKKKAVNPSPVVNGTPDKKVVTAAEKKVEATPEDAADEAMEDAEDVDASSLVWVNQQAKEYWGLMGMSEESLELGLKGADKAKAKALEKKWEHHGEAWLKIQAKQSELEKELFVALAGALKVKD